MPLIAAPKSVIPACDVRILGHLDDLVKATAHEAGIGAYKIGMTLEMRFGLRAVVQIIRGHNRDLPIIYDRQKGGTDIPDMGREFAEAAQEVGVDAVILFPFTGPRVEKVWIEECRKAGRHVIVGSHMTHAEFCEEQGGFISLAQLERVYDIAVDLGVESFVVPGNQPDLVKKYRDQIGDRMKSDNFTLYAPGFIDQGGNISDAGNVAGERWHAIVGRALYDHTHPRAMQEAARLLTAEIIRTA